MLVDNGPYRMDMYHGSTIDWPTAGSLWCHIQFPHLQVTRVYTNFVEHLDSLTVDDVCWESYSAQEMADRAPSRLSSLCLCDRAYWLTQKKLVFGVFIKDYAVHREGW